MQMYLSMLGTEQWENKTNNLLLACTYICVGQKIQY